MASVKEMRVRIGSVKSTQKITKALQMVAAAKLRRAQVAAESARPYASRMAHVIGNLANGMTGPDAPLLLGGNGKTQRHLLVVMATDRGLAGGFNSSIVRMARERIAALLAEGKDVKIIAIGRKVRDQLRRNHASRLLETYELGVKTATLGLVRPIAQKIIEMYQADQVDVVTLISSRFKSVVTQIPTVRQLIPAEVDRAGASAFYEYEPDEATILEHLLPQNIAVQILAAALDNQAGFYAAQMTAMDNATRNAGDLIKSLTIQMNRTRQAKITTELTEIISGASAL
ncbi:MAG TPA: F0F1 ATP synthase subunit gamma [Rhizomicrobium sp.]|jgi:F-type H+-transporting ATPase subunit gamma|nr:F0F1 ATP synthase subunit gamma [Rhizomicrobium sp.]